MRVGVLLAMLGIAWNAWLLFLRPDHGIAGCGDGCGDVLSSRWGVLAGVAVPWLGMVVHALAGVALWRRRPSWLAACLVMLGGSVVWFAWLQAVVLGMFCPWCMAAHAVGLAVVVNGVFALRRMERPTWRGWAAGAAAVVSLAVGQVLGPGPVTHRMEEGGGVASQEGVHFRRATRTVEFAGGRVYGVDVLPRLGPADAKHVLVEYFDYGCPACRTMQDHLAALRERHPRDIAVIVLPVPLEDACNPHLAPGDTRHAGSCEAARAALAVWRELPEEFERVHRALLRDLAEGRRIAEGLIHSAEDPWIGELLEANARDWVALSATVKHLPKLLITGRRVLHGLPSGEADFIRVMEAELGL